MRNKTVVSGIAHRRIKHPVDEQRARLLVHLIFDRLAANRHPDNDIDLVRRVLAGFAEAVRFEEGIGG